MRASDVSDFLEFIPRFLYDIKDLSGVDKPLHTTLIKNIFSPSAGENRAKPVFSTLTAPFSGAVKGLMFGTALTMGTIGTASAQEAPVRIASVELTQDVSAETRDEVAQAWQDAQDYSIENAVITYLVIGQTDRFSNDQLRGGFANMFTGDKNPHQVEFSNLKSFGSAENLEGSQFGFYIDGVQFGPFNFLEAIDQVPELSRKYLEHKPVHERRLAQEKRTTQSASVTSTTFTSAYE